MFCKLELTALYSMTPISFVIIHQSFSPGFFLFVLFPIAQPCQINQTKKLSLLSQIALTSQTKFSLRSTPKSHRKERTDPVRGSTDTDNEPQPDPDANRGVSPCGSGQLERHLSAGLDYTIYDLVSLDSQAEVDQGILLREWTLSTLYQSQAEATTDSYPPPL